MVEEGALFSKQLNIFHGNTIVESLSLSDHWYSCISFIQKVTTQMLHDWVCLPYISYWQYQNTNGKAVANLIHSSLLDSEWCTMGHKIFCILFYLDEHCVESLDFARDKFCGLLIFFMFMGILNHGYTCLIQNNTVFHKLEEVYSWVRENMKSTKIEPPQIWKIPQLL